MDDKKTLMFFGGQTNQPQPPASAPTPVAPPSYVPNPAPAPSSPPPVQPAPDGRAVPGYGAPPAPQQAAAYMPPQQARPPGQAPQHRPQHYQPQQQMRPQQPQQPAWGGYQPQGMAGMGAMGQVSKKKIFLGIAGAVGLAVLGVVGTIAKNKYGGGKSSKHTISYSRLGINKTNANVDQLIGALEGHARKWRKDAVWHGLTMYGVRPDGTVDLTDNGGAAIVKFVSPKGVQSHAKSVRKDSIKEYRMTRNGAKSNKIIGAKKAWKDFRPVSIPSCKVSDLVAALGQRGFKSGTVRVGFDVRFAFASGWAWTVDSKDKNLAGFYSMADCKFIKGR